MGANESPPTQTDEDRLLHVLLVEDDEVTLRMVEKLLKGCNYRVTITRNGREALEVLRSDDSSTIDLVLTDILMPEVTGLELATTLQDEAFSHIPVIVMSTREGQTVVMEAMEAGAQDYLIKPVRRNELATLWRHVWRQNPSRGAPSSVPATTEDRSGSKTKPQPQKQQKTNKNGSNDLQPGDTSEEQSADFTRLRALVDHSLKVQLAEEGQARATTHTEGPSQLQTSDSDGQGTGPSSNVGPLNGLHAPGSIFPFGSMPGLDVKPLQLPPPLLMANGGYLAAARHHQGSMASSNDLGMAASSSFSNSSGVRQSGGMPFTFFTALVPPPVPRQGPLAPAMGPPGAPMLPGGAGHPQQQQQQQALFLKAFHAAVQQHQAGMAMNGKHSTTTSEAKAHRQAAVERFRQKRKERSFEKKVRYESRKRLAETRPRVKGQFVKSEASAGAGSKATSTDIKIEANEFMQEIQN